MWKFDRGVILGHCNNEVFAYNGLQHENITIHMKLRIIFQIAAYMEKSFRMMCMVAFFGFWALYAYVMAMQYQSPVISTIAALCTLGILWLVVRDRSRWIGLMLMAVVTLALFGVFMFGGYITNWLNPQVNAVSGMSLIAALTFLQRAWLLRTLKRKSGMNTPPSLTP